MGFKETLKQFNQQGEQATRAMSESMYVLEKNLKQVQENQVEFEQYLKDIIERQKRIDKKLNETRRGWKRKE